MIAVEWRNPVTGVRRVVRLETVQEAQAFIDGRVAKYGNFSGFQMPIYLDEDGIEDELRDFDPTKEGGGGPCKHCGTRMDPWVYAQYCAPCLWYRVWEQPQEAERVDE